MGMEPYRSGRRGRDSPLTMCGAVAHLLAILTDASVKVTFFA